VHDGIAGDLGGGLLGEIGVEVVDDDAGAVLTQQLGSRGRCRAPTG
jgi:hypothetical protein